MMSLFLRLKRGSGTTWITRYTSPLSCPRWPAWPAPLITSVSPSLIPAGISKVTDLIFFVLPSPPQILHFSFGILPTPRHSGHIIDLLKLPKSELTFCRISPWPPHDGHCFRSDP